MSGMRKAQILRYGDINRSFCAFAGQPGLEVLPGKEAADGKAAAEGMWSPVDPLEGAITVNIGDALQYWTDDVLQSTYHRVRVPRADEYKVSFPSFYSKGDSDKTF